MPWRNRRVKAGFALALLAGTAGIAIGQTAPESLLPPGFGAPPPAPAPAAPGSNAPRIDAPAAPGQPAGPIVLPPGTEPIAPDPAEAAAAAEKADAMELPPAARRAIDTVGILSPEQGGFASDAFGNASGHYLTTLLNRLNAPIPSRWASILLRRALISQVPAPRGVRPADWVAERAWLLLRMGEADAARLLVQSVDIDRYSPWLIAVAKQAALATGDPVGLCAIAQAGMAASDDPSWPLAQAMCAALSGEGGTATAMIDRARQRGRARGIDLLLAEKVAGAGIGGRRAVTIDWTGVDRLTAWRFGLATAVAVPIPAELYSTVGPQVRAWAARSPMLTVRQRLKFARLAAALGVFSNSALVDLYGADADATDAMEIEGSVADRLRNAYAAAEPADRLAAIKALWASNGGPMDRYAASILTARAAARIAPDADVGEEIAPLIAAMLSAGLDIPAERWGKIVDASGDDAAWALLAVGAPGSVVDLSAGRVEDFVDNAGAAGRHRAQLLVAARAGLGRLSAADQARFGETLGPIVTRDRWTMALDAAVRARQPGTVAILAATGLQTRSWQTVPAGHLYQIVAALRRTGQEPAARMIAAEALSRA
jgi:hypothetical protein